MAISLEHRRVGDVTVVTCKGRLVEGSESVALRDVFEALWPYCRKFVLDVGALEFVDSSGLGLLVRYAARTRHASGTLKLCAPSGKMMTLLKTTRLEGVFDVHASEADAITACYQRSNAADGRSESSAEILCVVGSVDVQAYVRALLAQGGYGALTAGNLPDALILMHAVRPRLIVIASELRRARGTHVAETFNRLADGVSVIELPPDFAANDAADAGVWLLHQVRAVAAE